MRILYSGLCSPLQIQYVLTLAQSHPLLDLSGTYSRTDILSCYPSQVRCTIDSAQDPPPQRVQILHEPAITRRKYLFYLFGTPQRTISWPRSRFCWRFSRRIKHDQWLNLQQCGTDPLRTQVPYRVPGKMDAVSPSVPQLPHHSPTDRRLQMTKANDFLYFTNPIQ